MLLNGGTLDGVQILSPKTIELMTMNHTADLASIADRRSGLRLRSWLPRAHRSRQQPAAGSVGSYGWSGIYGTTFWVDPKEKLVAVMLVQRYPGSTVAAAFQPLVYQALTK